MALSETQRAVLAAYTVEQRTRVESDGFKDQRCACKHLVYPTQKPGDPCLFCACRNHEATAVSAPPAPKGRQ